MASLPAVVLVLSMYLIPPGLRPICHAAPMQVRCSFSATRSGGYATAVQIECSHECKSLNTARAARRFLLLADAEVLEKPWSLALAAFCSEARYRCLRMELK